MMSLGEIKEKIRNCLEKLYEEDAVLFDRNNGRGLCERCLVFRFGIYLQQAFPDYFVDCDFNSSQINGRAESGKPITNLDGTSTKRFVDIIIHRRNFPQNNDFICFEIKKWNNNTSRTRAKDLNILRGLTSEYGYRYGFYIILGKKKRKTQWAVFQNGNIIESMEQIFGT